VTGARSARPALHAADRVDGLWRTASRLVARRAARPGWGRGRSRACPRTCCSWGMNGTASGAC